eukprot:7322210-Prymnesium_polylepis.1
MALPPTTPAELIRSAARCLRPAFEADTSAMPFRPMGVLFSEALALISAAWLINATHIIESGTAE